MIQSSSMLRIFSAASTPFNSGMEISMIMIWLCSFSYSCTASFPLVASLICKISPKRLIKRLARAGVVATLLPLTAFSLNEPYAPARKMIDAGCAVALASDLNPGSCFSASIPMMIALACIYMKMTPEEAVTALTINGAAAVGRASEIGSISVGKRADVILLKYPSYKFLPYHVGMNLVDTVIKDGELYMM